MNKQLLQKFICLANRLDEKTLYEKADMIDRIIKKSVELEMKQERELPEEYVPPSDIKIVLFNEIKHKILEVYREWKEKLSGEDLEFLHNLVGTFVSELEGAKQQVKEGPKL